MMFGDRRRERRSLAMRTPRVCSERTYIRVTQFPTASTRSTVTASQAQSPQKKSGRTTLVEMAQARVLQAQDGHLMSRGDEFEFWRSATADPKREQGTEGGQKREHADDGMTASPKTLCFLSFSEF